MTQEAQDALTDFYQEYLSEISGADELIRRLHGLIAPILSDMMEDPETFPTTALVLRSPPDICGMIPIEVDGLETFDVLRATARAEAESGELLLFGALLRARYVADGFDADAIYHLVHHRDLEPRIFVLLFEQSDGGTSLIQTYLAESSQNVFDQSDIS